MWVPPYALLNIAIAVFVHTGKLMDAIVLLCLLNVYVALVLSFVWRLSKLPRTSQRTTSLFSPQGYHEALRIEDEESGNSLQSLETESSKGQVPVQALVPWSFQCAGSFGVNLPRVLTRQPLSYTVWFSGCCFVLDLCLVDGSLVWHTAASGGY